MYCVQCGNQLSEGSLFCCKCGKAINQSTGVNATATNVSAPSNYQKQPVYIQNTFVTPYQRKPITKVEYLKSDLCSPKAKSLQRVSFMMEMMIIIISGFFIGYFIMTIIQVMDAYSHHSDELSDAATHMILLYFFGWIGQFLLGREATKTKSISASIVYLVVVILITLTAVGQCVTYMLRAYEGLGAAICLISYIVTVAAPIVILGCNISLTAEYYRNTTPG